MIELTPGQRSYLDGWCVSLEDLPDGAWESATREAVERASETRSDFAGLDPDDIWDAWVDGRDS